MSLALKRTRIELPLLQINDISILMKFEKFKMYVVCLADGYNYEKLTTEDVFETLTDSEILDLKTNPKCYFLFDYFAEGTSYKWFNFYKIITDSVYRHNIPFNKIIFGSSNLREQESYDEWCQEVNQTEKFKLLIVNKWDSVFYGKMAINVPLDKTVEHLKVNFKKNFLHFNRRKREHRLLSIFELFKSNVFNDGFISFDKINDDNVFWVKWFYEETLQLKNVFDQDKWEELMNITPLVLDREDFEINWVDTKPSSLFQSTLFSLVSETLMEEHRALEPTPSLFYSEKTFKPMLYNHPLLIFGQSGANTMLTQLGYKTYDKYFNLDFDHEPNFLNRIKLVVQEVERVSKLLNSLSLDSKIEWYLQDRETLEHNKETLYSQAFNKKQLHNFIDNLIQESE